jgi:hypothetical protein
VEGAPPASPGWNGDGHPVVAVSTADVAAMVPRATRFLVF